PSPNGKVLVSMTSTDTSMLRQRHSHRMREARASTVGPIARGRTTLLAAAATALLLNGCAPFTPDAGMGAVQIAAAAELNKDVIKIDEGNGAFVEGKVRALLAKPLTASSAMQIALLNNRGLQAAYNDLGISEAQMIEASLPPSPSLAFR